MKNKIVHIFLNTDMRNQHDGLVRMAIKKKVDLTALQPGEHAIFVNTNADKFKIYSSDGTPDGVLSYKRSSSGPLNLLMIEQLPHCFGADGKINWDAAGKLALEKQLERAVTRKVKRAAKAKA